MQPVAPNVASLTMSQVPLYHPHCLSQCRCRRIHESYRSRRHTRSYSPRHRPADLGLEDRPLGRTKHVYNSMGHEVLLAPPLLAPYTESYSRARGQMCSYLHLNNVRRDGDPILRRMVSALPRLLGNSHGQHSMHNCAAPPYHELGLQPH